MISISVIMHDCVNLLQYLFNMDTVAVAINVQLISFFISLRPSLPPSKQANKNLILKAISEAQESVTKTTNYSTGNKHYFC